MVSGPVARMVVKVCSDNRPNLLRLTSIRLSRLVAVIEATEGRGLESEENSRGSLEKAHFSGDKLSDRQDAR